MSAKEFLKNEIAKSGLSKKRWYNECYLSSDHWKLLKQAKFEESGKLCEVCGTKENIQVHHKQYRNVFDVTTADLSVLCGTHHRELHGNKKRERRKERKHRKPERMIKSIEREIENYKKQSLSLNKKILEKEQELESLKKSLGWK